MEVQALDIGLSLDLPLSQKLVFAKADLPEATKKYFHDLSQGMMFPIYIDENRSISLRPLDTMVMLALDPDQSDLNEVIKIVHRNNLCPYLPREIN